MRMLGLLKYDFKVNTCFHRTFVVVFFRELELKKILLSITLLLVTIFELVLVFASGVKTNFVDLDFEQKSEN